MALAVQKASGGSRSVDGGRMDAAMLAEWQAVHKKKLVTEFAWSGAWRKLVRRQVAPSFAVQGVGRRG